MSDELKNYLSLARANRNYEEIAQATGFSSHQVWTMAQDGRAVMKKGKDGLIQPKDDERYLALGRLIPNVDPRQVQAAAQRSYEQRKAERKRSTQDVTSSTSTVEILCDPLLRLMRLNLLVEFERWLCTQEQPPRIPDWLNPGRFEREEIEALSRRLAAQPKPGQATIAARLLIMAAYSQDKQALGILIVKAAEFLGAQEKSEMASP